MPLQWHRHIKSLRKFRTFILGLMRWDEIEYHYPMGFDKFVIKKPSNLPRNGGIQITINEMNFWICNYEGLTHILHDECSHMSGALKATSSNLVCTVHGWTYNFDGSNQNTTGPSLQRLRILKESENEFEVLLPTKELQKPKLPLIHPLQIQIHSHATLEFSYREESVLFDPWLNGPHIMERGVSIQNRMCQSRI